jgi:dGTPase
MRTRTQLEDIEKVALAPWAARSGESRGRKYPDEEHAYRTAFQRDRERVLHTTAFRRLQGKTQVFVVTEGDYFRTRITHTMEVAQIGRSIARALGANEDLVEGICLAHDLGHPPFGHSGEATLSTLMEKYGGFDHNQHSYRIITELEQRFPDFPGLNLTYEFREGIVKHETDYDVVGQHAYESHLRGTVECQIASVADELAYNAHDLDDGLRAGLLNPDDMTDLGWWKRTMESLGMKVGEPFTDLLRHRFVRRLIGLLSTDLVQEAAKRIDAARVNGVDDVRHHKELLVTFPDATLKLNREWKAYLYEHMYRHYRVMRMHTKSARVLEDLFHTYNADPRILPDSTRAKLDGRPVERVVCDYIAGMTDRFALDEHARLFDPRERV